MKQYYSAICLLLLSSCTNPPQTDVDEIYAMMQGSFTSKTQAEENNTYHNITLRLAHIWKEREGKWVYAEYGLTEKPENPYSQRVYHLTAGPEDTIVMHSYELKENQNFIGKWESPEVFDSVPASMLRAKEACAIYFEKENDAYRGQTLGENCDHGLGKAEYWTHEFIVSDNKIINWARGYNTEDSLIWGQKQGGYVLLKTQ